MPIILAEELDELTLEQLKELEGSLGEGQALCFDIIDPHNLTDQHCEKLRLLTRRLHEPGRLDADELDAKLRNLSSLRSTTPSDTASTPRTAGADEDTTDEQHIEFLLRRCHENISCLRRLGGRPTCENVEKSHPCPPLRPESDPRYHAMDHWRRHALLTEWELGRWMQFRWYQFEQRRTTEKKARYIERIRSFNKERGFDWILELSIPRQTSLHEWREYFTYESMKLPALEKRLAQAQEELEAAKQRLVETERHEPLGAFEHITPERRCELRSNSTKKLQAKHQVELLEKRLAVLRHADWYPAMAKEAFTSQVEADLQLAQNVLQNTLQVENSEEMDMLDRQSRREGRQGAVAYAQSGLGNRMRYVNDLKGLLEWIADQIAELVSKDTPDSRQQQNQSVRDSWIVYYNYMRKRPMPGQEESDDDPWIKRIYQGLTVKWLQRLITWMEQEVLVEAVTFNKAHEKTLYPEPPSPALRETRKSTRRQGSASGDRPLQHYQTSRVFKPAQRAKPKRVHLETNPCKEFSTARNCATECARSGVAIRRSERIAKQARMPDHTPSGTSNALKPSLDHVTPSLLRRSARLSSSRTSRKLSRSK